MNVLVVTHHYLHGNGGGVFASRAYINAIAEIAEHVTLLYPDKEGAEIEKISPKVELIPVRDGRLMIGKVFGFIFGKLHRYYDVFEPVLVRGNYDIVVFDNSRVSFGMIDIVHRYNKRVITIHHNCELEYVRANSHGLFGLVNIFWTKKQEKEAVQKSDLNLTITRQDMDTFAKLYLGGKKDSLKYLGCFEFERSSPIVLNDYCYSEKKRFVITGNLSATQTEKSFLEWLDSYYPILCKIIPDFSLVVAGKNPSKQVIKACTARGIKLISSPVSMRPVLENADIYICPINLGGGLKLRVMDGLKYGLPVIAHKISARGYDEFVQSGYVLVYDNPASFAECLTAAKESSVIRHVVQTEYKRLFGFDTGVKRMKGIMYLNKKY